MTGVLLHAYDVFIQIVEGEQDVLTVLVNKIQRDPRHRNFMVVVEMEAASRSFGDWQMGFKRLDPSQTPDRSIFLATRQALESRIVRQDGGLMLNTVLAFARQDFLAEA